MTLSEIKEYLKQLEELQFLLPNGDSVPAHFHVTEIGKINKQFIDCGGTVREEHKINFQLWEDGNFDHRLGAKKLLSIIDLSERVLELSDSEIEVEYQGDTISKYGLEFGGKGFHLTRLQTDCLAKDNCGIPSEKPKIRLSSTGFSDKSACSPQSGCC
jgi:hypothetical protein